MTSNVTRMPERGTRGREIRYRKIHEIAEEILDLECRKADADGIALAKELLKMSADRVKVLEKGI